MSTKVNVLRNKKKIILLLITFILFSLIALALIRPDIRFIIKNSINQMKLEVQIKEVEMEDAYLEEVSINEIKNNSKYVYDNSLMLVNQQHMINRDEDVIEVGGRIVNYEETDVQMDEKLLDAYKKLKEATYAVTGSKLYIMDSYRTWDDQNKIYNEASNIAQIPGASEHQLGLALDVYTNQFAGRGFLKSEAGQFVNEKCWVYGFIIRYPLFKKNKTGIQFEPWHIRYVGLPHSEIIYKNNLTLEEYIFSLEIGKFYKTKNYIISRQEGDKLLIPNNVKNVVVSYDNTGCHIITGTCT